MYKKISNKKHPVTLKFDCRKMNRISVQEFKENLLRYLNVQVVGENLIYAEGLVTDYEYNQIWEIADSYNAQMED